jgi:hypothetical protein
MTLAKRALNRRENHKHEYPYPSDNFLSSKFRTAGVRYRNQQRATVDRTGRRIRIADARTKKTCRYAILRFWAWLWLNTRVEHSSLDYEISERLRYVGHVLFPKILI